MISHSTSWFGYQPKVNQFDILYNQNNLHIRWNKIRKKLPKSKDSAIQVHVQPVIV